MLCQMRPTPQNKSTNPEGAVFPLCFKFLSTLIYQDQNSPIIDQIKNNANNQGWFSCVKEKSESEY